MFKRYDFKYIDLNKAGTNQYKKKISSLTILGITLKTSVWKNIAIIGSMVIFAALVGYFAKQNERKMNMLENGLKVYAATTEREKKFSDERVQKLYNKLSYYNSPLAGYAQYIVAVSDEYAIDYTLIAAIAGKESSFGKHLANDYNAWGITGGKETRFRAFVSWEEGIRFEAQLLSEQYRKDMVAGIQTRYCPSFQCSDSWVDDVTAFSGEINK